jgi:mRNA interferase RelE/StbE
MNKPKAYRIEVSPVADRDLQKLRERIRLRDFEHLGSSITALAVEPRPNGVRQIKGTEVAYRIRVGSYRVVYEVYDSQRLVLIIQIARRSETTYRKGN